MISSFAVAGDYAGGRASGDGARFFFERRKGVMDEAGVGAEVLQPERVFAEDGVRLITPGECIDAT